MSATREDMIKLTEKAMEKHALSVEQVPSCHCNSALRSHWLRPRFTGVTCRMEVAEAVKLIPAVVKLFLKNR